MMQFVKPNLLGTKKEFSNRFKNPITAGQYADSSRAEVRWMNKRIYVLTQKLKGSINVRVCLSYM